MSLTLTTLPQATNAEATTDAATANAFWSSVDLGATHVAKIGQADAWFSTTMPVTREAEYDAASADVQNKFAIIGALANVQVAEEPTKTYLIAWEEQYLIMFP